MTFVCSTTPEGYRLLRLWSRDCAYTGSCLYLGQPGFISLSVLEQVVVCKSAPCQVHKHQDVDCSPYQVHTVEKIRVTISQHYPAMVKDR